MRNGTQDEEALPQRNSSPGAWAVQNRNVPPQISSISCKKTDHVRVRALTRVVNFEKGSAMEEASPLKRDRRPIKPVHRPKWDPIFLPLTIWLRHLRGGKPVSSCLLALPWDILGQLGSQIVRVIRSAGGRQTGLTSRSSSAECVTIVLQLY